MLSYSELARYEYKYSVHRDFRDPICAYLKCYCRVDPYGRPEKNGAYTVDSLYFDTDGYASFWDVQDRTPVRAKIRIRNYPDSPGPTVKFEVKRRVRDHIVKSAASVPRSSWVDWLLDREKLSKSEPQTRENLNAFITRCQTLNLRPKMLVRYERFAWLGVGDGEIRVTLDSNMLHQPMTRYELDGTSMGWTAMDDEVSLGYPSHFLVELKFAERAPLWMADMVRRFGLVRQGFSKYCCAVRRSVMEVNACRDLRAVGMHAL